MVLLLTASFLNSSPLSYYPLELCPLSSGNILEGKVKGSQKIDYMCLNSKPTCEVFLQGHRNRSLIVQDFSSYSTGKQTVRKPSEYKE